MGTLRWEKERAIHESHMKSEADAQLRRISLESEEALIEARLRAVQKELEAKRTEMGASRDRESARHLEQAQVRSRIQELRAAD